MPSTVQRRAAAESRAAIAQIPLTASDTEIGAGVASAVDPIIKAIEQRRRKDDLVSDGYLVLL
ncbi:MAG: hypothetical protein DMG30_18830 [Acidobacteria bacterium]|nr:MAG: hypothetical protein DMG30_18830 [Acidobacteriota bacterium]